MGVTLSRKPGETELQYIYRVGEARDSGLIDKTWGELAEIFNKELRDPDEHWSESAYRKKYAVMKQAFDEVFKDKYNTTAEMSNEIIALRRELEKEKVKLRDERNEYNKLIRQEARKESYMDQFCNAIAEAAGTHPLEYSGFHEVNTGESVICVPLTDIHAGMEIHNHWNNYDEDILRQMLKDYLNRVINIATSHNCGEVAVFCSESLSGIIHTSTRLQNNQDLIDQFLLITDYICDFLAELSPRFRKVHFYVAPGNHSRINPKKEEGLAHENLDNLIIPFVRSRMQLYDNVHCYNNPVDQGIATTTICGHKLVFTHGDKDDPATIAKNMTQMLGYSPAIILMCHRHFNAYLTSGYTKVIQSGSLVGPDEYAIGLRKIGRPEQTVFVINEYDGLECIYDVKF